MPHWSQVNKRWKLLNFFFIYFHSHTTHTPKTTGTHWFCTNPTTGPCPNRRGGWAPTSRVFTKRGSRTAVCQLICNRNSLHRAQNISKSRLRVSLVRWKNKITRNRNLDYTVTHLSNTRNCKYLFTNLQYQISIQNPKPHSPSPSPI